MCAQARCATSIAARPRLRPGMSWRRARCRPRFRPSASMASSIGTAGFSPTRRPRRFSTTIPRRNSLIFAVHMWNPMGPEPETIWEVLHRHKDIQYSSRVASHISRQRQVHKLRHVISELVKLIPEGARKDPVVKDLAEYGCLTRMHVVRLLAPRLDNENHTKDIDFSPTGISLRWEAGHA